MARPDDKRNTDVPATIAGFYCQILIACGEICKDDVTEVGVETGADVVSIDKNLKKTYIESKLYSRNFRRFSEEIIKTIYNFYNSYRKTFQIHKMLFLTNTGIVEDDAELFQKWGTEYDKEIEYLREAILRKSIESHNECKKNYRDFCMQLKSQSIEEKDYYATLKQKVLSSTGNCQYGDYAVENDDCSYRDFIQMMGFRFHSKGKRETLDVLTKAAKEKIIQDYYTMKENVSHSILSSEGAEYILGKLVKKFFDCIVGNSQSGTVKLISKEEYRRCLEEYLLDNKSCEEADRIMRILNMLGYDEEDLLDDLDLDEEEDIRFLKCYSAVKDLFLKKVQEEDGKLDFMNRYLLEEKIKTQDSEIGRTMIELMRMLAVILYEKGIEIQDVRLFFDEGIDNLKIHNMLCCCHKHAYGQTTISKFIRKLVTECSVLGNMHEEQIIVAGAHFYTDAKPCNRSEVPIEAYNIAQTDENFRDYQFLNSINYKCTDCLERGGANCEKFWKGGGGLCGKIS